MDKGEDIGERGKPLKQLAPLFDCDGLMAAMRVLLLRMRRRKYSRVQYRRKKLIILIKLKNRGFVFLI